MQISKKSSQVDFYGPRGFFLEHIELDFCVKFKVNQTYVWGAWPSQKRILKP